MALSFFMRHLIFHPMKYQLRNFENNLQMVSSLGWIFIIISLIFLAIRQNPALLLVTVFGVAMVWIQMRGKRIAVDTKAKTIRSAGKTYQIRNPAQLFINEVRVRQNVNSRAQSANIKTYFYKAYLMDGGEKILLSSNRNDTRDMEALQSIANDLGVELVKNY